MSSINNNLMISEENLISEERKRSRLINIVIISAAILCFLLLVILLIVFIPRIRKANQTYSFVYINDIHLDSLYIDNGVPDDYCRNQTNEMNVSFKFGQYGCDTPIPTFESMLKAIPKFVKDPKFIIFGGDFPGHALGLNETEHFSFIDDGLAKMKNMFPGIPLVFNIGNNDYNKNYGKFDTDLNDFMRLSEMKSLTFQNEDIKKAFRKGGYSFYDNKDMKLRVISLNTVIYTLKREYRDNDPYDQFSWLEEKIREAREKDMTVIVTMHVPPGYSYVDLKQGWYTGYIPEYDRIVKKYDIQYTFGAHSHLDMLMPIYGETGESKGYVLTSPAISMQHGNNPGFRIFKYKRGKLVDMEQYYADIMMNPKELDWKLEYKFSNAYDVKDLGRKSVLDAVKYSTETSEGKWKYYEKITAYAINNGKFFYCVLKATTAEQAKKCMGQLTEADHPLTPYDE